MLVNGFEKIQENLSHFIKERLAGEQAERLLIFARHYFKFVNYEDIEGVALEDLYGSLLSHWNVLLKYMPGASITYIYNPSLEDHGWQSQHTVIEIVTEDMPFLVRSVTMEINRHGLTNHLAIHPVFYIQRSPDGELLKISERPLPEAKPECLIHVEIDRQSNSDNIDKLQQDLLRILRDVRAATQDWRSCAQKMAACIETLKHTAARDSDQETAKADAIAFLQWLHDEHFVFLGCREYEFIKQNGQAQFKIIPESGLGILQDGIAGIPEKEGAVLSEDAYREISSNKPLIITKATSKSSVHRSVFMDYIGVKKLDHKGEVVGEIRFLGLYSSSAYSTPIKQIPIVSGKIESIMARSGFQRNSHDSRSLLFVLQSLPRDELFQADENSLFNTSMGVLRLQERQRVRVFIRHDVYGRFISLLIFVPRERYHTDSRKKIELILLQTFRGRNIDFSVQLSESILARIHFIIHSDEDCCIDYEAKEIEGKIKAVLSEWNDELAMDLLHYYGEARGNKFFQDYSEGFSAAYRDDFSSRTALLDLKSIENLEACPAQPQGVLYSPLTASEKKQLRFKLFCCGTKASLSKSLPMLENMGVKVYDEKPYEFHKAGSTKTFWMHDFGLSYQNTVPLDEDKLKSRFQGAFEHCWNGDTENDGFNRLIIAVGLTWRQVNIFRAYYLYLRQIDIAFSQAYVESTLAENPQVVKLLVKLFCSKFDPGRQQAGQYNHRLENDIKEAIDQVSSLDEDRILRRFFNLLQQTLRTNYFIDPVDELGIPYFSCKINSTKVDGMPTPVPYCEIFVYSPRMEGMHLRGGAVARGGIRWSDRREDFRTEILGLMKAQMTKNAVIVPSGAKGGFVVKQQHEMKDKESLQQEVIACYRILMRGMLDITDNLSGDRVVQPDNVLCSDAEDPYLVVAADRGTATFSDYANQLAKQYEFWLGDAFASGGSAGYDHKAMGITARGTWEAVTHHFEMLAMNIHTQAFTVIGIGGMSGDVFGNGMLLSKKIKLLGAFDHEAIFLDPAPDPELSYQERQRLFALSKASWWDYDANLISTGGGVFSRTAKSIQLSDEVKALLDLECEHITPNNMIRALLCASVDLMWNGGIGTYVKASDELHLTVADKANDAVRVDGRQLRCKIVGEGGNLGFTQLGRIEYALNNGKINTDSIDNSAGVDCSDHEVNIKILLDTLVKMGDLTGKQRNQLLQQMTDQVARLVLKHNYQQCRVISMIENESGKQLGVIRRLIEVLVEQGNLDRDLENIPNDEMLEERHAAGKGLVRPEIAVLLAYSKRLLKEILLDDAEVLEEELFTQELVAYFPSQLQEKFPAAILKHRLYREIVVNQLVNSLVNRLGMVFPYRLIDELGYSADSVVNAYVQVCKVYEINSLTDMLGRHDGDLDSEVLRESQGMIRKTVERAMYWFLSYKPRNIASSDTTRIYYQGLHELTPILSELLPEQQRLRVDDTVDRLIKGGVSADLALKLTMLEVLLQCLDVIDIQRRSECLLRDAATVFFHLLDTLYLSLMRQQIVSLPKDNSWQSQARNAMLEEYNEVLCSLVLEVLEQDSEEVENKIALWLSLNQQPMAKYQQLMKLINAEKQVDLEKITVVLKELRNFRGK